MVWTKQSRRRHDRRGQRYPTDLTNEEWSILEPLLPVPTGSGRPRRYSLREIMNGIRYVLRYGIPWDAMPKDLPPSSICYDYWRSLSDGGHMERINHHLVMADREKAGRGASPTLAIIDAQSVKCDAPQGERGYDAGKSPQRGALSAEVLGRKRHIAVDSGGRLLAVAITPANVQDQNGGIPLVKRLVRLCPWIATVVVDGGYKTLFIEAVQSAANRVVEVVKRPDFAKGFVLLPKRWKVEQTIGALTISRRLKLDYETLLHVSAAAMLFASITRLLASITAA
jgi:putative transposase